MPPVFEHQTKLRILEAAEPLMLEKGFHAVGLNEILASVNMPKGSFYHHFKSKEDFGVELLKHYTAEGHEYKRKMLLSPTPEPDPLQRLLTFFEQGVSKSCESGGKCPCLALKLASEVSNFSDPMREVLAESSATSIDILASVIREGIAKGSVSSKVDPPVMAALIFDLWSGAGLRAASERSTAPFRSAITFIRNALTI